MNQLKKIVCHFDISGELIHSKPLSTGHINDTFLANFKQKDQNVPYLFQRINHFVFRDPPALMENIVLVTEHIRRKLMAKGIDDISRRVLTVIATKQGRYYYQDQQGNFWRSYLYISRAKTYDTLLSNEQAYQIARSFGNFQLLLADFPPSDLNETIPNFHSGPKRYQDFLQAVERDKMNRAKLTTSEIDFIIRQKDHFFVLGDLLNSGKICLRISHNDTKINNVLVDDDSGEGICVLDLDTVMPGLSLYDFGDLGRTSLSSHSEDEKDLTKVQVELPRFEAITKGFLSSAGPIMNEVERQHMVFSIIYMSLIIGCRFLTDYLSGDVYFKVQKENHNLDRCRTQLKLVELLLQKQEELQKIVARERDCN